MLKSKVHVIMYASFQLCRVYPAEIIWTFYTQKDLSKRVKCVLYSFKKE